MFLGNAGAQLSGDNITQKELVRKKQHSSLSMITLLTNGKKLIPLIHALFWLSSYVASHCFSVAQQSGAKEQFYCTVYCITLNSNCEAERLSKNWEKL
jgi:hypothetical protein